MPSFPHAESGEDTAQKVFGLIPADQNAEFFGSDAEFRRDEVGVGEPGVCDIGLVWEGGCARLIRRFRCQCNGTLDGVYRAVERCAVFRHKCDGVVPPIKFTAGKKIGDARFQGVTSRAGLRGDSEPFREYPVEVRRLDGARQIGFVTNGN